MEYSLMSIDQLETKMKELDEQFKGYQAIFKEAYENMNELSEEYNKIKKIIDERR